MQDWLGYLIGAAALLVLAPLVAWAGRRHGRTVRGTAGLALILLGLGQLTDPPKRHLIESLEGSEEEGSEAAGAPPPPGR